MNCSAEIPMIGDNMICPITVTKHGSPIFAYSAMLDFGDGSVQNLTIRNTESAQQSFVVNFVHQYQVAAFYKTRFMIPILKIDRIVVENFEIKGNLIVYLFKKILVCCFIYYNLRSNFFKYYRLPKLSDQHFVNASTNKHFVCETN